MSVRSVFALIAFGTPVLLQASTSCEQVVVSAATKLTGDPTVLLLEGEVAWAPAPCWTLISPLGWRLLHSYFQPR